MYNMYFNIKKIVQKMIGLDYKTTWLLHDISLSQESARGFIGLPQGRCNNDISVIYPGFEFNVVQKYSFQNNHWCEYIITNPQIYCPPLQLTRRILS